MGDRVPVRHPREILMQMIWQMRYDAAVGIKGDRPEEEDLRRCLGKRDTLKSRFTLNPRMPKTNVSPGDFSIDPRLPNFPSLVSQLQIPIVAIPKFKIPMANGVPSMMFACVGNTTDHKYCHVGARVTKFGSFPELKEHCIDIRDVRFGKYADRITKATQRLRQISAARRFAKDQALKEQFGKRSVPRKDRNKAYAEARLESLSVMHEGADFNYRWGEIGQAFTGETSLMRPMCFTCRGIYPYKQVIKLTPDEERQKLVNEVGENAKRDHKCAASLLCNNMMPLWSGR